MINSNSNDKVRTLIVWEVPVLGSTAFVEMYVNPQNLKISDKKLIQNQRTKGGYILQYWGEDFTDISLSGSTGAGGIEAINVLRDVYRSEQLTLQKILQSRGQSSKRRQSLGQLATSVVMWYQGQGFRGFFETFNYDEATSGFFTYTATFKAVEIIGERKNFMPWHRKPWSTVNQPSFDNGQGFLVGGAYDSNFKIGELNAPVENGSAVLRDTEFEKKTGDQPQQQDLQANLEENNERLTPSSLFAN